MVKSVIVDDESMARATLRQELTHYCPEIEIVAEASSCAMAIEVIDRVQPDLVFLDIQLSDGSGFDVIDALKHLNFKVIFTTAFSEYAIKAIQVSALDYLLKPIEASDLIRAVLKTQESQLSNYKKQIDSLIHNRHSNLNQRIAFPTSDGIHIFDIKEIIRCVSDGNYTTIHRVGNKKLMIAKTLKDITAMLEEYGFERIHKSHIINLEHLTSYINKDGGHVVMSDGSEIPVSQRRKSHLLNILSSTN